MTTIVTVRACCPSDTEVVVSLCPDRASEAAVVEETILQDGESKEVFVYDDRAVSVYERRKGT
jgi:hypothetical protein